MLYIFSRTFEKHELRENMYSTKMCTLFPVYSGQCITKYTHILLDRLNSWLLYTAHCGLYGTGAAEGVGKRGRGGGGARGGEGVPPGEEGGCAVY